MQLLGLLRLHFFKNHFDDKLWPCLSFTSHRQATDATIHVLKIPSNIKHVGFSLINQVFPIYGRRLSPWDPSAPACPMRRPANRPDRGGRVWCPDRHGKCCDHIPKDLKNGGLTSQTSDLRSRNCKFLQKWCFDVPQNWDEKIKQWWFYLHCEAPSIFRDHQDIPQILPLATSLPRSHRPLHVGPWFFEGRQGGHLHSFGGCWNDHFSWSNPQFCCWNPMKSPYFRGEMILWLQNPLMFHRFLGIFGEHPGLEGRISHRPSSQWSHFPQGILPGYSASVMGCMMNAIHWRSVNPNNSWESARRILRCLKLMWCFSLWKWMTIQLASQKVLTTVLYEKQFHPKIWMPCSIWKWYAASAGWRLSIRDGTTPFFAGE